MTQPATQNGRAMTEVIAPPVATSEGAIPTSDTLNIASAAAIVQRCVERFKLVRIFEEVFGHVPVKNMAGRFRAADGADQREPMCGQCGLYPEAVGGKCFGCHVRGARS